MSTVVALKYNNGVIIASDRQITSGNMKFNNNVDKIHKSKYSNTAYGMCGSLRDLDLVSCNVDDLMDYKDILDNVTLDKKYIVNKIVSKIFNILIRYNRICKDNDMYSMSDEFIIVDSSNIFIVSEDGSVLEADEFASIGSGYQLIKGYIDALNLSYDRIKESEAEIICVNSISKSCKDEIFVGDSYIDMIILRDNGSYEFKHIFKDDTLKEVDINDLPH